MSGAALQAYFEEIFCRHPWRQSDLPSLVYQEEGGQIVGCLGVMPRRMSLNGREIQAAITHHFMVGPGSRSTLAALELARMFLAGQQDLSVAEGGSVSQKIVERFGGATSCLHSIRWTRPLRPGRYFLSVLQRRGLSTALGWMLVPWGYAADTLAPLILPKSFVLSAPRLAGEELEPQMFLSCLSELTRHRSLRPEYDARSLQWLVDLLAKRSDRGTLQKVVLRCASGEIVGWYLYYLKPRAVSEVVQLAAKQGEMGKVLEHLFFHAWRGKAVAVSGQLDPEALHIFSEKGCVLHHDGSSWVLIHAKQPAALEAIHRGDAFFTRLEGEWSIAA